MTQLDFQKDTRLFAPELDNLARQLRFSITSNGNVTESGAPAMSVDVAAGVMIFDLVQTNIAASLGLAIAASDPTNDRIDLVVVNSSGVASVLTGSPAADIPKAPVYDAEAFYPLARVLVQATVVTIVNANIFDQRVENGGTSPGNFRYVQLFGQRCLH